MIFDVFQWHQPFLGMFQVQFVVYTLCALVLSLISYHRHQSFQLLKDGAQLSGGWLALSMMSTLMANMVSASLFEMQAPMLLVALESIAAFWLSVHGVHALFTPCLNMNIPISDMRPKNG